MEVPVGGRASGGLRQRLDQTLDDVLETIHGVVHAVNVVQSRHLDQPSNKYIYIIYKRFNNIFSPVVLGVDVVGHGPGGELVPLVHRAAVH